MDTPNFLKTKEKILAIKPFMETAFGNILEHQELENMLAICTIVSFSTNDIVFHQGDTIKGIYLILKGTVDLIARTLGKGIAKIETCLTGDFLGETSFLLNEPSSTSAVAKDEVQCLFIPYTYFELMSAFSPEAKYKIIKAIGYQVCGRLKRLHDKIITSISRFDMQSLSFFGRIIHTFAQPKTMTLDESEINKDQISQKSSFLSLTQDETKELLKHATFLAANKNCVLIRENEIIPACYIVIHGAVQSNVMQDNKVAKLSVIGPDTLFASTACFMKDTNFSITFITCESAILLKISEEGLEYFQKNKPTLWYKLFNLICGSIISLARSLNKLDIRLNIEKYNR
ncbi:signal peptide protein [Legionella norrlandica]|uniref:Signal peptide protein n=1 Tax=Legionella norrlandica TaxID=1498499 RepID=A0A0A2SUY7_9GAMM|nr:cyclic nucleotide-binding domain-containing protein [Legionella norrlandica]KGP63254.1 signal peptide protein [Legionella norrlandica]